MNDDEDVGQPSQPEGLIDHEAIAKIMEKAKDALRPIGLTLEAAAVQISVQPDGQRRTVDTSCRLEPRAGNDFELSRADLSHLGRESFEKPFVDRELHIAPQSPRYL